MISLYIAMLIIAKEAGEALSAGSPPPPVFEVGVAGLLVILIFFLFKVSSDAKEAHRRAMEDAHTIIEAREKEIASTKADRDRQILEIKAIYEHKAAVLWEPLEKALHETKDRLQGFQETIRELNAKISSQENEIYYLEAYRKQYKEALRYINRLLEVISATEKGAPPVPEILRTSLLSEAFFSAKGEEKREMANTFDDIITKETNSNTDTEESEDV